MARAVRIGNSLCREISGGEETSRRKEGRKEEEELRLGRGEKSGAEGKQSPDKAFIHGNFFPLDPPPHFFPLFLPTLFSRPIMFLAPINIL